MKKKLKPVAKRRPILLIDGKYTSYREFELDLTTRLSDIGSQRMEEPVTGRTFLLDGIGRSFHHLQFTQRRNGRLVLAITIQPPRKSPRSAASQAILYVP